uniref:exonuclease GOR-like n=1 Tax=Styela clava TaxID=7725 RepID=UPI001939EE1C|nr:exonuclease GOR-like [Styela clava]
MAEGGTRKRRQKGQKATGVRVYDAMMKYVASPGQLDRHGFPRPGQQQDKAKFSCSPPKEAFNNTKHKTCYRCGDSFILEKSGRITGGECWYHSGRLHDDGYTCCGEDEDEEGCTTAKTHVHRDNVLDRYGYVETYEKPIPYGVNPGIYAIDCEMSYTVNGMELTCVSIVDENCDTVYDTYVKPYGRILDYNTQFSGVTKKCLRGETTTLEDVQNFMLETFSKDTILVGHSLESDFVALRLIHEKVVDTSLIFTHPMGFPYKYALRTLARKKIGKTVQDGEHDSEEDATTCMQIMLDRIGFSV